MPPSNPALARIAARRRRGAKRYVAEARRALDSDPAIANDLEQYFPYLVGYVALVTGDLKTAEARFTTTTQTMERDPFQVVLLGMSYEKVGDTAKANELYRKAYGMSTGSNPPNVFSRTFTRTRLGIE